MFLFIHYCMHGEYDEDYIMKYVCAVQIRLIACMFRVHIYVYIYYCTLVLNFCT